MPHQELYNKMIGDNHSNGNATEILKNQIIEFPYFSAAHFLLLKETSETSNDYKKRAALTALHFNNPFFLKYQLDKKTGKKGPSVISKSFEAIPAEMVEQNEIIVPQEPVISDNSSSGLKPIDVAVTPEKVTLQDEQKEEVPVASKEELLFEPLHTSDYFASQGIKLSEEVQPSDKLGKQLKSFTDWLKTMKKVHTGNLPEGNAQIDIAVQSLAEKSNKEQEILTESMADVYLQQGKQKKALEIYKKLSLLNPAKSAYFAAKIELLKEN